MTKVRHPLSVGKVVLVSRSTEVELRAQVFDAFDRLTQLLLRHGQDPDLVARLPGWRQDLAEVPGQAKHVRKRALTALARERRQLWRCGVSKHTNPMEHARVSREPNKLAPIATRRVAIGVAAQSGLRAIRVFLSYLGIVLGHQESEPVRRLLLEALGPRGEEVYMTWQDHIEARGEARGRAEVLRQQRALFLELLEQRFGAVPAEAAERVGAADMDQLAAWTRRLLRVGSLDELFER